MEKLHYIQEHMGNISEEMYSLTKNQKEIVEIKNTSSQKLRMPLMSSLTIRAWPRTESVSLKKW